MGIILGSNCSYFVRPLQLTPIPMQVVDVHMERFPVMQQLAIFVEYIRQVNADFYLLYGVGHGLHIAQCTMVLEISRDY